MPDLPLPIAHTSSGLEDFIAISRYARYSPERRRRETWAEAVGRVRDMHLSHYPERALADAKLSALASGEVSESDLAHLESLGNLHQAITAAFAAVERREVLPSMRSLQFGGDAVLNKHARIYNCCFTYIDRIDAFRETFYLLLCGCGVGFSVQTHHISKLPVFSELRPEIPPLTHFVHDTIEGWADALDLLMTEALKGHRVIFDYSLIRPEGAPLKTSGGKAPGPQPLFHSLCRIDEIVRGAAGRRLRSIEAYDILMWAAKAVLSGGVRRSATICLFSADDASMVSAKTGDWFATHPQRAASNNSAVIVRATATREQFDALFEAQKQFGEPGFYFVEDTEYGANPCVPADTWVMTEDGPRQAGDLIGDPFRALVHGVPHDSTRRGFFPTGEKPLVKITSNEGHTLRATANHRVLVARSMRRTRSKVTASATRERTWTTEWVEAGNLMPGDRIVLHRHQGASWGGYGSQEEGWLLGLLLGDGNVSESKATAYLDFWGEERHQMLQSAVAAIHASVGSSGSVPPRGGDQPAFRRSRVGSRRLFDLAGRFGIVPGSKTLNSMIERTSSDFHAGFIRGWMDTDGSVQGTQAKGVSIRLTSVSIENLQVAQRMLLRLGINSTLYLDRNRNRPFNLLPDGKGGKALFAVQPIHELVVAGENLTTFAARVGFSSPSKRASLHQALGSYRRALNKDDFHATVAAVTSDGTEPVYDCTVPGPDAFDANGFYAHNCVEIGLHPRLTIDLETQARLRELGYQGPLNLGDVLSGVQFCNLTTISANAVNAPSDFLRLCAHAALIGTLQAGYTDFHYLSPVSRVITEREALLGVSICGILDRPSILLDPNVLQSGAAVVRAVNAVVARALGINPAARTTCVKPEGTASLLLGTSSGLHPHHSRRYFRRVQTNVHDPIYLHFKRTNPHMIETSVYDPNGRTEVITFPVEGPDFGIYREDVSAVKHLEYIKLVQENWVQAGRRHERHSPGLHHNVSCTVTVRPDEWRLVADFIWSHRGSFTGVALLQDYGDKAYQQAPREALSTAADIEKWNTLTYFPVDYTALEESEDITELKQTVACAGGACEIA